MVFQDQLFESFDGGKLRFVRRKHSCRLQQGSYGISHSAVLRSTVRSNIVDRSKKFLKLLEGVNRGPILDSSDYRWIGTTSVPTHYFSYKFGFNLS